jgi:putative sterol carrier protein
VTGEAEQGGARLTDLDAHQLIEVLGRVQPSDPRLAGIDEVCRAIDPKDLDKKEFVALLAALDRLAAAGVDLDLSLMDPVNFARLITRASKDQVARLMEQPGLRGRILDEIFRRMHAHYRSEQAAKVRAVVHWRFTGGAGEDGYDRYESVLADGQCTVNTVRTQDPRCTVTIDPTDFLRLVTNNASAPVLFMTGKVKIKGDLAFAAGITSLFDLPRAE